MVMETCDKVVRALGTADIDARLEELLIDGILYAYQEQVGGCVGGGWGRVGQRVECLPAGRSCSLVAFLVAFSAPTRSRCACLPACLPSLCKLPSVKQLGCVLCLLLGLVVHRALALALAASHPPTPTRRCCCCCSWPTSPPWC